MCINILPQNLAPVFSCPAVLDRSSIKGFIQVSPDYGCRLWHRETIFYLFFCSTQSFTVCAAVFGWCKFGCLPGEDARPQLALWRLTCKEIERERERSRKNTLDTHTQDRLLTFPSGNGGVFRFNECCHTKMEVSSLGLWGQHPLMKCRRVKKQFARLLCSEWQPVESLFFAVSPVPCHRNSLNHWKTEPLTATRAPEPSREHIGTKQNSTDCAEKGLLSPSVACRVRVSSLLFQAAGRWSGRSCISVPILRAKSFIINRNTPTRAPFPRTCPTPRVFLLAIGFRFAQEADLVSNEYLIGK